MVKEARPPLPPPARCPGGVSVCLRLSRLVGDRLGSAPLARR